MEGYEEEQRRKRKGLPICQEKYGFDNKLPHIADAQSPKVINSNRGI